MIIRQFLSSDLANRLGWTLLHSLWEGVVVAALLAIVLASLRRRSSQSRYLASSAALAVMLVCVSVTFVQISSRDRNETSAPPQTARAVAAPASAVSRSTGTETTAAILKTVPATSTVATPISPIAAVVSEARRDEGVSERVSVVAPWLSGAWAIGVFLLSLWHLGGWIAAQRMRVLGTRPVRAELMETAATLARRLHLNRPPALLQSLLAETPVVIGWIRPAVLLPVAVLTGLTRQQLEAVLAHELAHIRRHDYLVNLFQVAAETLLFYHPAVWFISRRIRLEREQCCDDVALSVCTDRCTYAGSLAALEEVRLAGSLALAARGAGGGQLLARVRRLLGQTDDAPHRLARVTTAVAVLILGAFVTGGVWRSSTAHAVGSDQPKDGVAPATGPAAVEPSDWLTGMWIHHRVDNPGPTEPTIYILEFGADGSWRQSAIWGTIDKPTKAEIYARGAKISLARLDRDHLGLYSGSAHWTPKPEYSLSLLLDTNSSLHPGLLARKDANAIVFHNFSSIHWTNEYAKASDKVREPLLLLFAKEQARMAVPAFDPLVARVQALIKANFPDAVVAASPDSFSAQHAVREFQIHNTGKGGHIAVEAHKETGPDADGFILTLSRMREPYAGQAVVPQTLERPYWKTFDDARFDPATHEGVSVHFDHGSRLKPDFKAELLKLIATAPAASADTHREVLEAELQKARTAAIRVEEAFKAGLISRMEWLEAKEKVDVLEAELSGDPVKVAKIKFEAATERFERVKALYESSLLSNTEFENAKADVDVARAKLREAEAKAGPGPVNAVPAAVDQLPVNPQTAFMQVERFARLPADQQAADFAHFYREIAPGSVSPMAVMVLSSYPEDILKEGRFVSPGGDYEARWAKQLQEAAATLSPEQVSQKLSFVMVRAAAHVRTLDVLRKHPKALAKLLNEDLDSANLPNVSRACAVIAVLKVRGFTEKLLALHAANTPLSKPAESALVWLADPAMVRPLLDQVERDPKSLVRSAGLFQGPLQGRPVEPALVKLLGSTDADIRNAAAYALIECTDPALAAPIAKLAKDPDPRLHDAALRMAMRLPDDAFKSVRDDLVPLLSSKTPALQFTAITCFAKRKDLVAGPVILLKLKLDKVDDTVTIMQALDALTGSTFGYDQHNWGWGPVKNRDAIARFERWLADRRAEVPSIKLEAAKTQGMPPGDKAADQAAPQGELAGTVVDEDGKPLAGALVDVWTWCLGNETKTDEQGRFSVRKLGTEPVEIRVSKEGFGPWYVPVQPTGRNDLRVTLSDKTYFEGKVTGLNGNSRCSALIRADSGPKSNQKFEITNVWTEIGSDPGGNYRLYVSPDTYVIHASAFEGGVYKSAAIPIRAGEKKRLDITLAPGVAFKAQVVDSQTGAPVSNVHLSNFRFPSVKGVSDNNGNVVIEWMQPGKFAFDVQAAGYTRWWSPQAVEVYQRKDEASFPRNFDSMDFDLKEGMAPVRIELEREVRIAGIVLDPDGKPVAGATVAPADGTGNSLTGDTRYSVPTGPDGKFVILLPASGKTKYNLEAHDGNHGQWRQWANGVVDPIQTKPGDDLKDVVIKLTRPATVRGHVKDETGKPVAGRGVRASAADRLENRYYDPTTSTDKDGNFELRFIRPGDQYIEVAPFWMREDDPPAGHSVKVTLQAGDTKKDVNLTAPASTRFPSNEEQLRRAIERAAKAEQAK